MIGDGYIRNGQDTLYYEKFNTINKNYGHQYQQNVKAAYSEAYSTYTGYYNSGAINQPYVFKIPTYNGMPDATTLSTSQNADNSLKSLSVSGCNLNPSFISSATNYTCTIDSSAKQVTVSAVKTSPYATVSGDGVVLLNQKITIVKVNVTAANGNVRTYTITINKIEPGKESPSDIISSLGYNNSNNIVSNISLDTNVSDIISKIKNKFPSATIIVRNKNNDIITSGIIVTGDTLTITNNNQNKTFTTSITGDINSDGKIDIADLLKVQKHIKNASKLSGVYLSSADINKDSIVDIGDLLKVQKHIKGVSKIVR